MDVTRPMVVIAETIAPAGVAALEEQCVVDLAVGVTRDELMGRLGGARGLVVRSATRVDAELIAAAPGLAVIGRAGIGVDNIDLEAATRAGVLVVNAPAANVISAAEHTMALLLAQARHLPQADATLRSGIWDRSGFEGVELHGKTLGIIGLGRVGTLVAQRALAFGMRLIAYDPFVGADRARRLGVDLVSDLGDLLSQVDFISIHLPRTRDTEGLIGAAAMEAMRPGVRIVNTSRGGIVDEEALAVAVRSGRVAGAALDVFATEPLTESPLFELPQVVLTPHLGASTVEAQDKAGVDVARAVAAALGGELVLSAVNVDLGREVGEEVRTFLPLAESLGGVFVALAHGLPGEVTVRTEGRVAEHTVRPLVLAALKGALTAVSTVPVTFVNAAPLAAERGISVVEEAVLEAQDFVSLVRLSGTVGGRLVSVAGTIGRKGAMLVDILDHDVELPFSAHMLVLHNADVPGMIGRVGSYLGELGINIANMVVGRSSGSGEAAMMGLNLDQALSEAQVEGLRAIDGIIDAVAVELPL